MEPLYSPLSGAGFHSVAGSVIYTEMGILIHSWSQSDVVPTQALLFSHRAALGKAFHLSCVRLLVCTVRATGALTS